MRIGLLMPAIFMAKRFERKVFAPKQLFIWLANELVSRGNAVFVYSSSNTETNAQLIIGNEELENNDVRVSGAPKTDSGLLLSELCTSREYDVDLTSRAIEHANTARLAILHDYGGYFSPYFLKFAQMPLVFSLHNPPPLYTTMDAHRFDKFRSCNYIAHSQSQKRGYNALNIHNIDVIYHGVPMSDFPFNDSSASFLINIGRFIPDKGVGIALQLAVKLRLPIKIATSGDYQDTDYYQQEIKPYLGSEFVEQLPFLEGEEKSRYLRNAKLFLFPIRWEEPFGMVLIESMATGTPVIAFARGSVPEIIKDGETGLIVNPSDDDIRGDWVIKKAGTEGLREAVERIYTMPQERYKEMRQACRAHVEKFFTVRRMAEQYEKVYEKVLSSRS
jgi:glycosyltransferase involved in cell wall biosynthesis